MMPCHPRLNAPAPSRAEFALLAAVLVLLAVALFGPSVALPAHYHAFADTRGAFGIPHVGAVLAGFTLLLAPVAAGLPLVNGNMGPWAVVQGGGLVLLAALAGLRPRPGAAGFSIATVIVLYALAKGLEVADPAVFELTRGGVSGHSLKHGVAALAAVPVLLALHRLKCHARATPTGQNHLPAAGTQGSGGHRQAATARPA